MRVCKFCRHPRRRELEVAILERRMTKSEVAKIIGVSPAMVTWHFKYHLTPEMKTLKATEMDPQLREIAKKQIAEEIDKVGILKRIIKELQKRLDTLFHYDIIKENEYAIKALVSEIRGAITDLAKLEGELTENTIINVNIVNEIKILHNFILELHPELAQEYEEYLKKHLNKAVIAEAVT